MISVDEFHSILRKRDERKAHQIFKNSVLEYILHYKGVRRYDIERLICQCGAKGEWDAKMLNFLGQRRCGKRRDGGSIRKT